MLALIQLADNKTDEWFATIHHSILARRFRPNTQAHWNINTNNVG